jgi:hypothetical protein
MLIFSKGSYVNANTGIRLHYAVRIVAVVVTAGSVGDEADGPGTHWPSAAAAAAAACDSGAAVCDSGAAVCDSGAAAFEFDAAAS